MSAHHQPTGKFNPSNYLRGLGWTGPGTALTDAPHARAKPVTVAQKKTLAGVGKDRDTSFAWWEMVFESVAKKSGGPVDNVKKDLHKTSTGIISPRPPPKASAWETDNPTASTSKPLLQPTPSASTSFSSTSANSTPLGLGSGTSGINMVALAEAKIEMARRQLYSSFLRGQGLKGSLEDEIEKEKAAKKVKGEEKVKKSSKGKEKEGTKEERKAARKAAKRARKEEEDASTSASDGVLVSAVPSEAEEEENRPKKKKKKSKSGTATPSLPYLSPEESIAADELAFREAKEAARLAKKEERRLEKIVRKALRDKAGSVQA
ncbi:hypothetical protein MNV49_004923 [Pseudohyphozyma bogoriensis]|nr:hypothetical protein MNV49_004923 [Pseudohyphozyma bogoriensis]